MVAVGKFAVVGVDGVRVVAGDEKAARHETAVFAAVHAERGAQPRERVIKESGCRTLLRLAADLLIVERAEDRHAARGLRGQKALEQTEHAAEIVQPGMERLSPAARNAVSEEKAHWRSSSRGAEMYSPSVTPFWGS